MKTYVTLMVYLHQFNLGTKTGRVVITPHHFTGIESATHSVGGWIVTSFGLDAIEKSNVLSLPRIDVSLPSPEPSHYSEYATMVLLIKRSPNYVFYCRSNGIISDAVR